MRLIMMTNSLYSFCMDFIVWIHFCPKVMNTNIISADITGSKMLMLMSSVNNKIELHSNIIHTFQSNFKKIALRYQNKMLQRKKIGRMRREWRTKKKQFILSIIARSVRENEETNRNVFFTLLLLSFLLSFGWNMLL